MPLSRLHSTLPAPSPRLRQSTQSARLGDAVNRVDVAAVSGRLRSDSAAGTDPMHRSDRPRAAPGYVEKDGEQVAGEGRATDDVTHAHREDHGQRARKQDREDDDRERDEREHGGDARELLLPTAREDFPRTSSQVVPSLSETDTFGAGLVNGWA